MIRFEGGKTYSVRTEAEKLAALREDWKSLSPEEQQAVELLLAEHELRARGAYPEAAPSLLSTLETIEWREKPVSVEQFLKDPYYLGQSTEELYDVYRQDLSEIFEGGGYHEVIYTGAIGTGKSFVVSVGVIRVLYELSCMVDPHGAFHIARNTPIDLVCFSVTEELAIKVAFDYIIEKLQQSPYFRERFPFRDTKKEYLFPGKIRIAARATTDTSALGMNVICGWIDEGNFMPKPGKAMKLAGEKDKAEKIYNSLKRRMKSRFERRGKLPGMMFVVSSKRRTDDFTNKIIERSRDDRTVFVRDRSLWDVKPESYPEERFQVFVGNSTIPSRVLKSEEVDEYKALAESSDGSVVIDVPINFKPDFEDDTEEAIRDIAGIATVTVAPFIQRRDRIKAAADFGDKQGLFHPFSVKTYVPGTLRESDELFLWDRMVESATRPLETGGYESYKRPRVNPLAIRHAHIDPSLNGDATGLAVGHIAGYKEVLRRDSNRQKYAERAPVIVVDALLQIKAPPGEELILGDVRGLVYQMVEHGYPIRFVSMDRYQSIDGLQQMRSRGLKAEVVSVDVKPDAYDTFKTALYEGRVIFYGYQVVIEELANLEKNHMTGKVDHPPLGCFVGETRIPLLDGTFPQISELVGREVWVYSATAEGCIVPGRARGRVTKMVRDLVDVVLDSGAVERCTPEHRWMLRDGTYKEARHLRPGIDRLMPISRQWPVNGGYERVVDREGRRTLTHHMVWTADSGPIPEGYCVHHINHTKTDNRPENLSAEPLDRHAREHATLRHRTDPEWRRKLHEGARTFNESEVGRARHADAMRRTTAAMSSEDLRARARARGSFRQDVTRERLEQLRGDPEATTANAAARILGCGRNVIVRVLRDECFASWGEFLCSEPGCNHKVRAVIPVRLDEAVSVYDLEVDRWSNFALASGVFVHNSKDVSDALAALVFTLTTMVDSTSTPLPFLRSVSYAAGPMAMPTLPAEGPSPVAPVFPMPFLRGES